MRLVGFETPSGKVSIYINPEHVVTVRPSDKGDISAIALVDGKIEQVKGDAVAVKAKLEPA